MTVTLAMPPHTGVWTVDDLARIDDERNRYEIVDGSLLVSPMPARPHAIATDRLTTVLKRQAPAGLLVLAVGMGVEIPSRRSYYVPDVLVTTDEAMASDDGNLMPGEVLLVVEVLSPSNARVDLILKRHEYAAAGIAAYWIVDPRERTVTVLSGSGYRDESTVKAGETWHGEVPFPVTLDPAEFL